VAVLCRVVNGEPQSVSSWTAEVHVGMVQDGSPCGRDAMCIHRQCVPLGLVVPVTCPTGHNGLVCSGRGVS